MAALASSTFSAGAKETVATVDVYAKNARTVVNSVQDIRKLFDTDLLESFRGGNLGSGIRPIIKGVNSLGLIIDKASLLQRLVGSNPRLMAGFKKLSGTLSDAIGSMVGAKDGIFATVGGVVSKISAAAVGSVKQLGSLIGDVVGSAWDFVVDDKDGISGFYSGLIKEAQNLGIPGVFKEIISTVRDPNLINRITQKVIPSIVGTSDLGGLLSAAIGTSKGVLQALNPQLLSDFSRKYTSPANGMLRNLQSQGNGIFRAFDAVDKNWDKFERVLGDGTKETATNITLIQNSSKDAQDAIRTATYRQDPDVKSDNRDFYSLANVFKPVTVHEEIKKDFPMLTTAQDVKGTPDPRLTGDWGMDTTILTEYNAVKKKQEAYSTDMSLLDKIKNVYF